MKKILPVIVIIIIILVIAGALVLGKNKPGSTPGGTSQQTTGGTQGSSSQQDQSFTGKLKDALALGMAMKCEWKTDETNFGTTWVKNNNMYNEVSADGKIAYAIVKDNCLWSWGQQGDQGVTMCYEPEEGSAGTTPNSSGQTQGGPPPDIDYHCQPEVFSDTKFSPPGNITFMDMSKLQGIGQ